MGAGPVITLTTDFGGRDPWVGTMKGVMIGIVPGAQLIDLAHEIARHDVWEAALALEAAAPYFPAGTVHLAVVDPEVGSARRGLVVVLPNQRFVGPDNGVFTPFLTGDRWRAFQLSAVEFHLTDVSATFHGRDVFAPAAAHLAAGVQPDRFGPPVSDPVRLRWPVATRVGDGVVGEVIHVDRFGNLATSIMAEEMPSEPVVGIGGRSVSLARTYADVGTGGLVAMVGSGKRLEVAVREGSAAETLGLGRGARVEVTPRMRRPIAGA